MIPPPGQPADALGPVDEPVPAPTATSDEVVVDPAGADDGFVRLDHRLAAWWGWLTRRWGDDPGRAVEAVVSAATVIVCTAVILGALHPGDLWSTTTPTGGDMGAHVWGPRYLADHLLPHWRLTGWTPDWYDGFPAYQFYMVVPSLFVVALFVGLPWYAGVVVVLLALAGIVAAWWFPRLYRWRWFLTVVGAVVVVLAVPIPYNRSFKLVTAAGLLAMPVACWFLARASRLPFPVPPLAAAASLLFVFNHDPAYNNTGNIIGGNFTSTMAGEFAFSIGLTLSIVYLGVAVRGLRTGRHRALAAVLFALAGLCHLIPAFFVLACTVGLFLVSPGKGRFRWLATTVPVAGLLTAFWVVPFALRHQYVNDMGWERLPLANGDETSIWYYLLPNGLRWLFLMALIGVLISVVRMHRVGLVLGFAWIGVWAAFAWLPQMRLWNARLLPFMFLAVALLAAIGLGEILRLIAATASGDPARPMRAVSVATSVLAIALTLVYVVLPMNGMLDGRVQRQVVTKADGTQVTRSSWWIFQTDYLNPALGWSGNNYTGLEAKTAKPEGCDAPGSTVACTSGGWPEYKALVQTMAGIGEDPRYGCGRAFWEYNNERFAGYGTPMALMMLPYFTDGCIGSQEGLYFESSATVPYHFLMSPELSTAGSTPQRDLPYPGFDIDAGVRHLQLLGVRYYLATTPNAVDQASRHPDLTEIAVTGGWHIYEIAEAPTVAPLAYEPAVVTGIDQTQEGWLPTSVAWFRQSDLSVPLAASGPDDWARVEARPVPTDDRAMVKWVRDQLGLTGPIDQVPSTVRKELPAVEVTDIDQGRDTISFDVSEPGVPILVKTSYFPNWEVSGAKGPYRVTPNLMVVIPTDTHVEMRYGRTPVDLLAYVLTLVGLVGLVLLARRPRIEVAPEREPRLSRWVDRVIAIPAVVGPADEAPALDDAAPADGAPADALEGDLDATGPSADADVDVDVDVDAASGSASSPSVAASDLSAEPEAD